MNEEICNKVKFGSPLHKKLTDAIRQRLRMSDARFSDRYRVMAQNEELFQAYIPTQDVDRLRKTNREQRGVPEYTTIELPYSYSVVMTAHTYYSSVFCSRSPVFQLSGRHGESETNVQANEVLLAYQMSVGANMLPLFVWLLDPGKYGFGVIGHYWEKETIRVRKTRKVQPSFFGQPIEGAEAETETYVEEVPGYEGSKLYNVRPQDWYPDPRVSLVNFQRGEFCGRYVEVPWNEIYEGSRHREGQYRYCNYEKLHRDRSAKSSSAEATFPSRDEGSSRVTTLPNTGIGANEGFDVPVGFIKGHEFFFKLIPSDYQLGPEKKQEIWVFNVSSNGIIFGANSLGEYHGKFPFDLITDEIDGYSIFPRSTLERCKPLNDVMTWLVNTHFYNVRQALNNQFVVDPSMVVMKDVENPLPGRAIRLKPTAYGKDVRAAINQLQTMDITRTHVSDLALVMDMVQRMVPANDSMMGVQPQGSSRQTATSVRTSTHFSTSRLKTQCEWWSACGWGPLAQKLVQRQQQFYSQEKKYRLVGDVAQFSPEFVMVTPDAISGFYDFEPVDGTLPIDRFAQANLWQMILGQMQKHPEILMTYDIAKIFAWVSYLGGIKNLQQFRLTRDDLLMRQARAGNVVPIGQATREVTGQPKGNMNEPQQTALAGPTG